MQRPYILYLYPSNSSFIKKDIKILEKKYRVVEFEQNWPNKRILVLNLIRQFFFLIWLAPRCKVIFVMFGGWWSLFPSLIGKLFQKRVFIILGGTDCVSYPSLNYGYLRSSLLRNVVFFSYHFAHRLLPVDKSLVYSKNLYFENIINKNQGFQYFFPKLKTPHTIIYNGFDSQKFHKNQLEKLPLTFITIAGVADKMRFELKGVKQIFEIAPFFPQCRFTVVGIDPDFKATLNVIPSNITLLPFLGSENFISLLSQSTFYIQLSLSEGFPNALCEAMLCECVPIVSEVGAMPFIVQDTGFVVSNSKIETSVAVLTKALLENNAQIENRAQRARLRISENFDIKMRELALFSLIEN